MSVRKRTDHGREGSAGAAEIEKPTRANQRVGGLGVRKARAKALDYCDKSVELRTCGGTVRLCVIVLNRGRKAAFHHSCQNH